MTLPLMPKATAVWLVENTALTFQQIADFCGLHELEVQAIADGEVAAGMQGWDPVGNGQLTREEIARCEADPALRLKLIKANIPLPQAKGKGPRYTPISRRQTLLSKSLSYFGVDATYATSIAVLRRILAQETARMAKLVRGANPLSLPGHE